MQSNFRYWNLLNLWTIKNSLSNFLISKTIFKGFLKDVITDNCHKKHLLPNLIFTFRDFETKG
jgi:hypothetical protein